MLAPPLAPEDSPDLDGKSNRTSLTNSVVCARMTDATFQLHEALALARSFRSGRAKNLQQSEAMTRHQSKVLWAFPLSISRWGVPCRRRLLRERIKAMSMLVCVRRMCRSDGSLSAYRYLASDHPARPVFRSAIVSVEPYLGFTSPEGGVSDAPRRAARSVSLARSVRS